MMFFVSKIRLGYEEALWPKQLVISLANQMIVRFWFSLSYLIILYQIHLEMHIWHSSAINDDFL